MYYYYIKIGEYILKQGYNEVRRGTRSEDTDARL
jgi:hypothetical protein